MERVGEYVIESKLSQGGMAEVFLAHSSTHQRQVVVKSLFADRAHDGRMVAMMVYEARIAAQLAHPNVVQVLDLVEAEGRPFIVMEFLDGQNLRQIMHRAVTTHRPISPAAACRIIIDVLAGLGYAHAYKNEQGAPLGLVHRDASPANVLITWSGNVKIIDFGVAKATRGTDRGLTRCGEVKGKIAYMSPEQIQRQPLDARTDLFSVGIILWELLTLRRLFAKKSDFESLLAVVSGEIAPPSAHVEGVPAELDAVCLKALARDPQQRYSTAEEMIADLEAVVAKQGWAATPQALRQELQMLFSEEDGEVELIHELPPPRETTTRTTQRGEPLALLALQEAPTDPGLYESWDDAARSYKARTLSSGFRLAIAAACLLLGAAAATVARQITSHPPVTAISAAP